MAIAVFKYSPVDFLFTCVGLIFLLLDIALDVFAVVSFYLEKAYVPLGFLLLFLVGSSVLVQAFSWLWYSYDDFGRRTKVEKCLSKKVLKLLHVLQLGIYFRHAGVFEMSVCSYFTKSSDPKDMAEYLSHDLSMLRLIETFAESSPQLVLMLTVILQRGELDPVTVLKALGSASAVAFSVTMYHRSLRSFLADKKPQPLMSSVVYFLWNLFLLSSRLTALALFASVLPCFIVTHFLCSWIILLFFVWRSKTDFMESPCGEWLFRATVGLIWYFNWFNVAEGKTRYRTLLYHGYILLDMFLLCGLWYWMMSTDPPYYKIPHLYAIIIAVCVVAVYMLGLFCKMIYYQCYHPNLAKGELKGDTIDQEPISKEIEGLDVPDFPMLTAGLQGVSYDNAMPHFLNETDSMTDVTCRSAAPAPESKPYNKRMRKLAENFYS
ncbi:XK-related protein 8-like [Morone saxatilis]|uniref:XK-related protein 8-like n=1 Tax=Morone saxatilis TaxID=34816 RepID=UPI0015E1FEFE|nr:XK-related protein 8-like [Morone saxatilis]